MRSKAAAEFYLVRDSARFLITAAGCPPPTSPAEQHKSACLHASWAMLVAAWEAYLERLIREVQQIIADPSHAKLSAVLALLKLITENEVKRFNTPNSENSRNLLYQHTGYDPINDWQWAKAGLSGIQTRNRLDEILRVRHSFAHGFPIPTNIAWVKNRNTLGRLNVGTLKSVDGFLSNLVKQTDVGMSRHLIAVFGSAPSW
jgi:hypothetical protein